MSGPDFDPRRYRIFSDEVNHENLEAAADVLNICAEKINQAIRSYEGIKRYAEVHKASRIGNQAYRAVKDRWTLSEDEASEDIGWGELESKSEARKGPDQEPGLEHDRRPTIHGSTYGREAKEAMLNAERNYLDAVERAEEEVDFPEK